MRQKNFGNLRIFGWLISKNVSQTKKIGELLAKEILSSPSKKKAVIIGLSGDLGGGKTTFLQGFSRGLKIKEKILSPTFIIMRRSPIPRRRCSKFQNFYHLDCYRLKNPKELNGLGFKEIIANPRNIVAAEWADRIRKLLPKETLWIRFEFIDEKTRKISLISAAGNTPTLK